MFNKHKDMKGYLSEKLQCEPELIDKIFRSNSLLKKVHVTKFERVFDLLYSEGLTPQEIRYFMCLHETLVKEKLKFSGYCQEV